MVQEKRAYRTGRVELPSFVSHGTANAYTNYACRCARCKKAIGYYRSVMRAKNPEKHTRYMREYMREYRARKRAEADA